MGIFDDEEPEEKQPRHDKEFTLGAGTLLFIFFGLVLLCGLCFGLGYRVGNRGSQSAVAGQAVGSGAQTPPQANGSPAKPMAAPSAVAAPEPASGTPAPAGQSTAAQLAVAAPATANGPSSNAPATANSQAQVRPALPQSATEPGSPTNIHPVFPPAVQLMVQIAAVSHQEDADVLADALRKRGYAVSARRDPGDTLIHVRIGPFSSRADADRWRLKLLNDGYNAMIMP
jgi:cell division septation protein DedD